MLLSVLKKLVGETPSDKALARLKCATTYGPVNSVGI